MKSSLAAVITALLTIMLALHAAPSVAQLRPEDKQKQMEQEASDRATQLAAAEKAATEITDNDEVQALAGSMLASAGTYDKAVPALQRAVHVERALVDQAWAVEQTLPPQRRTGKVPAEIRTEREASAYLKQVHAALGMSGRAAGKK